MTTANADTILNQLTKANKNNGRNRMVATTGAHNFGLVENGVRFNFKGSQKFNGCEIKLTAMDDYTVTMFKVTPKTMVVETTEGIYANQLPEFFTKVTGLDTHL